MSEQGQPVKRIGLKGEPCSITIDDENHHIYVSTRNADMVTIIDALSLQEIKSIRIDQEPHGILIPTGTHKVYVSHCRTSSVCILDGKTLARIGSINVGDGPWKMAMMPDGVHVIVLNGYQSIGYDDTASVIDSSIDEEVGRIPLGGGPRDLVVDSLHEKIYVPNLGSNTLSIIDLPTYAFREERVLGIWINTAAVDSETGYLVAASISGSVAKVHPGLCSYQTTFLGGGISGLEINQETGQIYATDPYGPSLWILDEESLEVQDEIPVGRVPGQIVADNRRNKLFVATGDSWPLTVIDMQTHASRQRWYWDFAPEAMALCPEEGTLFVVSRSELGTAKYVVVIDTASEQIIRRVRRPFFWGDVWKIHADGSQHRVYVLNAGGLGGDENPSVTVLDCASGDILRTIKTGQHPVDIAVRREDGVAFIANAMDNSVSVISSNLELEHTIPVGGGPTSLAYDDVLDTLFVYSVVTANVQAYAGRTFSELSIKSVGNTRNDAASDYLLLNPTTHQVWVYDPPAGGIFLVSGAEMARR